MLDRCYLAEAMPTLLVWGEHDGVSRSSTRASPTRPCRGAASRSTEAGHFPHHTDPDRFVADLRDFIATTDAFEHDHEVWRERLVSGAATPLDAGEPEGETKVPALRGLI